MSEESKTFLDCLKEAIRHCRENDIPFSRDTYRAVAHHLDLDYKSDSAARTQYGSWDAAVVEAYRTMKLMIIGGSDSEYSFLKQRIIPSNKVYRIGVLPDIHVPFENKKAVDCALKAFESDEVDEIVQLGDLMDCYKISRFIKDPSRGVSINKEIELSRDLLIEIKERTGAKKATFIEGNHEARIRKYLHSQAGALASLAGLRLEKLLSLDEIEWDHIEEHEFYGVNKVHFTHGEFANKYTSRKHMETYGVTVIHGHTHKLQTHMNKFLDRQIEGWEMGCLSSLDVSKDYVKCANWQHGFGIVELYNDEYWINSYHIKDGCVMYKGKYIEGKK